MEHIDKQTFKQIFHDHWEAFKAAFPRYNNPYYDEVVQKMLDCADPEKMGFAQYRCIFCGDIRRIAFSCKSSFCLSCSKVYTDRWADFIGRRLFPSVTYRHIVLTVPDFLRPSAGLGRGIFGGIPPRVAREKVPESGKGIQLAMDFSGHPLDPCP